MTMDDFIYWNGRLDKRFDLSMRLAIAVVKMKETAAILPTFKLGREVIRRKYPTLSELGIKSDPATSENISILDLPTGRDAG